MPEDQSDGEQNVYGGEARESLMEDGEISPEEDAFMQGYDSADREEEDSASDAYEAAFSTRKVKRRRSKQDPFDDDDPDDE